MKIALIKCSGGLNIGNEFINAGGEWLLRQVLPEASFYSFEFYDSSIGDDYQFASKPLTDSSFEFISSCDLAIVFGGSILSRRTRSILKYFSTLKCRKFLMGAGCWEYDAAEKELCREAVTWFDGIITRDERSFGWFEGASNVHSGMDFAFFAKDALALPNEKKGYAVINMDMIREHRARIKEEFSNYKKTFGTVYVTENTHTPYYDVPGYLFMSYWESFYALYANASEVLTNRIHTSVVCTTNQVPFRYDGADQGGDLGRNTLFGRVGMKLEKGRFYDRDALIEVAPMIEKRKSEMKSTVGHLLVI